ncbi:SCO-spondin [Nymphon striatum]|nr:SCO-spondin [Nymphon striatum]
MKRDEERKRRRNREHICKYRPRKKKRAQEEQARECLLFGSSSRGKYSKKGALPFLPEAIKKYEKCKKPNAPSGGTITCQSESFNSRYKTKKAIKWKFVEYGVNTITEHSMANCMPLKANAPTYYSKIAQKMLSSNEEYGRTLSVFIDNTQYDFSRDDSGVILKVGKKKIGLPVILEDLTVEKIAQYTIIRNLAQGFRIQWDGNWTIMASIEHTRALNKTCGLCGSYDRTIENDLETSSGKITTDIVHFAESWKMGKIEESCEATNSVDETCNYGTPEEVSYSEKASEVCGRVLSPAYMSCHTLVDPKPYYDACRAEFCECKSISCVCDTLAEYFRECLRLGGKLVSNWRTTDFCYKTCSNNKEYQECGSSCPLTCKKTTQGCDKDFCVDGCHCPRNTVLSSGKCITQDECPCEHNDKKYDTNEIIQQDLHAKEGNGNVQMKKCEARCSAVGDRSYVTFDGKKYRFHGKCMYYLVYNKLFSVELDNTPCSASANKDHDISKICTKSVIIRNGGHVLKLKKDLDVTLNGEVVSLPLSTAAFIVSKSSSLFINVYLSSGLVVQWDGKHRIYVDASTSLYGKTKGLCGTFNNNQNDDYLSPDGDVESDLLSFVEKWKTSDECLGNPQEQPTDDECEINSQNKQTAVEHCKILNGPLFSKCHFAIDPESFYLVCLQEMCGCTGSIESCLCDYLADYAAQCSKQLSTGIEWRSRVKHCSVKCPGSQVFEHCISWCYRSCADISQKIPCTHGCVEGCTCKKGYALDAEGACVHVSQCPCVFEQKEYKSGHKKIIGNELCECTIGQWKCKEAQLSGSLPNRNLIDECSVKNMVFTDCKNTCQLSCDSYNKPKQCTVLNCQSGCQCKEGLIYDANSKSCVRLEDCPCQHARKYHKKDQKIRIDCNNCICKKGLWSCEQKKCPGICTIWGASHYKTFDGKFYDFSGECDYVLAKGEDKLKPENSFIVSSKNQRFTLKADKSLQVPTSIRFILREVGMFVYLYTDVGVSIQWDRGTRMYVRIAPQWFGKDYVETLMVIKLMNIYLQQGGIPEVNVNIFGDSWKLHEFCLKPVQPKDACSIHNNRKSWAVEQCAILLSDLFSPCHAFVPVVDYHKRCISDACACDSGGDCACLCTAIATYAQECSIHNVHIRWRSERICPIQCDVKCSRYEPCISPCLKPTCENNSKGIINKVCEMDVCVEGCAPIECKPNEVYNNEKEFKCIPRSDCKIKCKIINGVTYYEDDKVTDVTIVDQCQTCHCRRGRIRCIGRPCTTIPSLPATTAPIPTCQKSGWTPWFNSNKPAGGDYELIGSPDLYKLFSLYCSEASISKLDCRVADSKTSYQLINQVVSCSLPKGLICEDGKQVSGSCYDYEVRMYCECGHLTTAGFFTETTQVPITAAPSVPLERCIVPGWTNWMNSFKPNLYGDYESKDGLRKKYTFCPDKEVIDYECKEVGSEKSGKNFLGAKCSSDECEYPRGMESGYIDRNQITASSSTNFKVSEGRLHSSTAWEPIMSNKPQWITVDLLEPQMITGLITQGNSNTKNRVTQYQVLYGTTSTSLQPVINENNGKPVSFQGNSNPYETRKVIFPNAVKARFITIKPTIWAGRISLRFEVLGCNIHVKHPLLSTTVQPTTKMLQMKPSRLMCGWSDWMNVDRPDDSKSDNGDIESFDKLEKFYKICNKSDIAEIDCRQVGTQQSWRTVHQNNLNCDLKNGFACYNEDQISSWCYDYEVSVFCNSPGCASTTPYLQAVTTESISTESTYPHPTTEEVTSPQSKCPSGYVWDDCAINCQKTCDSFKELLLRSNLCNPKNNNCIANCRRENECYYPMVWRDYDSCVKVDECTCEGPHGLMAPNSIIESDCKRCQCVNNSVECNVISNCKLKELPSVKENATSATPTCPKGLVYKECGTGCESTCKNYLKNRPCPIICVAGCFCAPGLLREGDTCITADSCPSSTEIPVTSIKNETVTPKSCISGWTSWMSSSKPNIAGDIENEKNLRKVGYEFCSTEMITSIQCGLIHYDLDGSESMEFNIQENVLCNLKTGLICLISELKNNEYCKDYAVRFYCSCENIFPKITSVIPEPPVTTTLIASKTTPTCPSILIYDECGTACEATCETRLKSSPCPLICVSGCFCPPGLLKYREMCISPNKCNITTKTPIVSTTIGTSPQPPCVSGWTWWMSSNKPNIAGDTENEKKLRKTGYEFCSNDMITSIQCGEIQHSLNGNESVELKTQETVLCNLRNGLICLNAELNNGQYCKDYAIRFYCSCENITSTTSARTSTPPMTTTLIMLITVPTCPPGLIYTDCGTACEATCENYKIQTSCQLICVQGCFCPLGLLRNGNDCIPPESCNIFTTPKPSMTTLLIKPKVSTTKPSLTTHLITTTVMASRLTSSETSTFYRPKATPSVVPTCIPGWTWWMSSHVPKNLIEIENYKNLRNSGYNFCSENLIASIECGQILKSSNGSETVVAGVQVNVICDISKGLLCQDSDLEGSGTCKDYAVRFYCTCPVLTSASSSHQFPSSTSSDSMCLHAAQFFINLNYKSDLIGCIDESARLTNSCDCECNKCAPGLRLCSTNQVCVNESKWCDGVVDCPDDEINCPYPTVPACPKPQIPTCPDFTELVVADLSVSCPQYECEPISTVSPKLCDTTIQGETNSCQINGDYISTFDGNSYDVDYCHHILLNKRNSSDFQVQIIKKCSDSQSCEKYIQIQVDNHRFEIYSNKRIKYNGISLTINSLNALDQRYPDILSSIVGETFVFRSLKYHWDFSWDFKQWIKMTVSKCLKFKVNGLCGFYDGDESNDWEIPSGEVNSKTEEFVNSWAVGDQSKCHPQICPPMHLQLATQTCNKLLSHHAPVNGSILCQKAEEIEKKLEHNDFKAADSLFGHWKQRHGSSLKKLQGEAAGVDMDAAEQWRKEVMEDILKSYPPNLLGPMFGQCLSTNGRVEQLLNACISSMCQCTQVSSYEECRCFVLLPFITHCETKLGKELSAWRIEMQCGLEWRDCGSACEKTCQNYRDTAPCTFDCIPGCFCPSGLVRIGDTCATPDKCFDCVCKGHGDPNFIGFDGDYFTFQGNCTYVLAQDRTYNSEHGFQVLVSNVECPQEPGTTCAEGITIRYNNSEAKIFYKRLITFDGINITETQFPFHQSGFMISSAMEGDGTIYIDDINLLVSYHSVNYGFSVSLPSRLFYNRTEGLCGICNFDSSDDFYHKSGYIEEDVDKFAFSWLIDQKPRDKCTVLKTIVPTIPPNICNFTVNECELFIDPNLYQKSCVVDVSHSIFKNLSLCRSMMQYAFKCCEQDISLTSWLKSQSCGVTCPYDMEYRCGSGCDQTCESYNNPCTKPSTYNCFCKGNKVLKNGRCVNPENCRSCDNAGHDVNDVWTVSPCETCHCTEQLKVKCIKEECQPPPPCGPYEFLKKRAINNSCCDIYYCEPPGKTLCPIVAIPKCLQYEVAQLQITEGCPYYECVCNYLLCPNATHEKPEQLERGQIYTVEQVGCCKEIKYSCNISACLPEPTCPVGTQQEKSFGICCEIYSCGMHHMLIQILKKNVCLYSHQFKVTTDGFEVTNTEDTNYEYQIGDQWNDGLCKNCSCQELVSSFAMAKCDVTNCFQSISNEDYEIEYSTVAGKCCKIPKKIRCKHDRDQIEIGESVQDKDDKCKKYVCMTTNGVPDKIETIKECDRECSLGYKYIEPYDNSSTCCGKCVKTQCVEDGKLYKVGDVWNSTLKKCYTVECTLDSRQLEAIYSKKQCPFISSDCPPDAIEMDESGCCPMCRVKTGGCQRKELKRNETIKLFQQKHPIQGYCTNYDEIEDDIGICSGQCASHIEFQNKHIDLMERPHECQTAWSKASDEQIIKYKKVLYKNLQNIKYDNNLLRCTNTSCTEHAPALSKFYNDIISACTNASDMCIPRSGSNNAAKGSGRKIPGWSEHVDNLRRESLSWHYWRVSGKPYDGYVAENRRLFRARYHRAIRRIMRDNNKIRMERMTEAIVKSRTRDLWKEVRKIKGRNGAISASIDGVVVYSYNYNEITHIYGDGIKDSTCASINRTWTNSNHDAINSEVNVLKEMIEVQAGKKICDCMATDDVLYIISDICLNLRNY